MFFRGGSELATGLTASAERGEDFFGGSSGMTTILGAGVVTGWEAGVGRTGTGATGGSSGGTVRTGVSGPGVGAGLRAVSLANSNSSTFLRLRPPLDRGGAALSPWGLVGFDSMSLRFKRESLRRYLR